MKRITRHERIKAIDDARSDREIIQLVRTLDDDGKAELLKFMVDLLSEREAERERDRQRGYDEF